MKVEYLFNIKFFSVLTVFSKAFESSMRVISSANEASFIKGINGFVSFSDVFTN